MVSKLEERSGRHEDTTMQAAGLAGRSGNRPDARPPVLASRFGFGAQRSCITEHFLHMGNLDGVGQHPLLSRNTSTRIRLQKEKIETGGQECCEVPPALLTN